MLQKAIHIMKKMIIIIVAGLLFFITWLVEPISYNPFLLTQVPPVRSSIQFDCLHDGINEDKNLKRTADTLLASYMSEQKFLGVSVGFSDKACGRYLASSGYSNKRDARAANADMLTRIASITKPMTAVAIMQLYQKGLIDLDLPIENYLPELVQLSGKKITVRQLLSHTSGIAHYQSKLDAISFSHYSSLEQAAATILEREFIAAPGDKFVYSSFGYTLLGAIIENISQLSFEEYLTKNIWQKAAMENTSLERGEYYPNKSRLYIKVGSLFVRSPYNDLSIIYSAGGVQSTVADLLIFGEAIIANKLITRQTLEMMIDVNGSLSPKAGDDPYGLGWAVYNSPDGDTIIAHSGAQPGASSYFEIHLDKEIVVATLSNAFGTKSSSYQLSKDMVNLVL
jgi:CubicO group peptidase (beta-lactamase class C family)